MSILVIMCALTAWAAVLAKPVAPTLSLGGEQPLSPSGSLGAIKNPRVKKLLEMRAKISGLKVLPYIYISKATEV